MIPEERRIEYFNYLQNYDVEGLSNMIIELQKEEKRIIDEYNN